MRHGVTQYNLENKLTGQKDISIVDTDLDRLNGIFWKLSSLNLDKIITSELSRTKETATIAQKILNIPIHSDARLNEVNYGIYQGMNKNEIRRIDKKFKNQFEYVNPGGESIQNAYLRSTQFFKELLSSNNVNLIITHSGIIRCIYMYMNNLKFEEIINLEINHDKLLVAWQDGINFGAYFLQL